MTDNNCCSPATRPARVEAEEVFSKPRYRSVREDHDYRVEVFLPGVAKGDVNVSVDAGHTASLTFNDLQLVFCNLLRGGIVILDDWCVHKHSSYRETLFYDVLYSNLILFLVLVEFRLLLGSTHGGEYNFA